jgi:hypothetical protein
VIEDAATTYIVLVHGGDWEWPDVFGPFVDREKAEEFYVDFLRDDPRVESWAIQPIFDAFDLLAWRANVDSLLAEDE